MPDKRREGRLETMTYRFEEPFMLNKKSQNRFIETIVTELLEGGPPEGMVFKVRLYFGKFPEKQTSLRVM